MILYEMIVLIIRYSDENLQDLYKRKRSYIDSIDTNVMIRRTNMENYDLPRKNLVLQELAKADAEIKFWVNPIKLKSIKISVLFIDIFFPLILGLISLIIIFSPIIDSF